MTQVCVLKTLCAIKPHTEQEHILHYIYYERIHSSAKFMEMGLPRFVSKRSCSSTDCWNRVKNFLTQLMALRKNVMLSLKRKKVSQLQESTLKTWSVRPSGDRVSEVI